MAPDSKGAQKGAGGLLVGIFSPSEAEGGGCALHGLLGQFEEAPPPPPPPFSYATSNSASFRGDIRTMSSATEACESGL